MDVNTRGSALFPCIYSLVWHWQPPYLVQTQLFVDIQFPVGKQLHKRLGALRRLFCPLRQILQIIFRNYN